MRRIILILFMLFLIILIPVEAETLPGTKAKDADNKIAAARGNIKKANTDKAVELLLEGIPVMHPPQSN